MMRILKWCRRYWLALLLVIAMGYLWMKADEAKRTAYAAWRTANEAESTAYAAKSTANEAKRTADAAWLMARFKY